MVYKTYVICNVTYKNTYNLYLKIKFDEKKKIMHQRNCQGHLSSGRTWTRNVKDAGAGLWPSAGRPH